MSFPSILFMFVVGVMFTSMLPAVLSIVLTLVVLPFSALSGTVGSGTQSIKFEFKPPFVSGIEAMSSENFGGPFIMVFYMLVFQLPELFAAYVFSAKAVTKGQYAEAAGLAVCGIFLVTVVRFALQLRAFKKNGRYCLPSKDISQRYIIVDNRNGKYGADLTLIFNGDTKRVFRAGMSYVVYSTRPSLEIQISEQPNTQKILVGKKDQWGWKLPIEKVRGQFGPCLSIIRESRFYPDNNKMWV